MEFKFLDFDKILQNDRLRIFMRSYNLILPYQILQ